MKNRTWRVYFIVVLAGLAGLGKPMPVFAADGADAVGRLERLEQRVNQLAERQEQFIHRVGAQLERQGPLPQPGNEGLHRPLPPAGAPIAAPTLPAARAAKGLHDLIGLLFFIGIICNILLAVWIFTDIRKRGEGSGIFVAMALVAGIPAALIYSLTRIGDKKT